MDEAKTYYDEMLKLREQNDRLREALQGAVRCWETDLAIGYEVDRYYYAKAKEALQEDSDDQ